MVQSDLTYIFNYTYTKINVLYIWDTSCYNSIDIPTLAPTSPPTQTSCLRWRLIFAILGAMGMAIIYGLKVNLSVAIVAMVNHTALAAVDHQNNDTNHVVTDNVTNSEDVCFDPNAKSDQGGQSEDGPFLWTEPEQGLVLGSYFWGYLLTQIPGGRMAELFGGKWVFFLAVVMNMVATILSPICAYAGYQYLILMRIIEGKFKIMLMLCKFFNFNPKIYHDLFLQS